MIIYEIGPIDFWFGWLPVDKMFEGREADDFDIPSWDEVHERLKRAKEAALELGWEGDIREGPFFAPIPWETGLYEYLLAWKQDNNGITFVVSPVRLPWLEQEGAAWLQA